MSMATKSKKGTVSRGTVQGLLRANGGWFAVVSQFTSPPGLPVISSLVKIDDLKGSHRKKAERWRDWLNK